MSFKYKFEYQFHYLRYPRASNRRDSPLINYFVFATLPNPFQHYPFINFGEFCQLPLLFQTPHLLIHVHSFL